MKPGDTISIRIDRIDYPERLNWPIIPCVNTGHATHKYTILTTDVIAYLRRREASPDDCRVILPKGSTPYQIALQLTSEGIPTPGGKVKWNSSVVKSILSNEKYKGDALLQKSYSESFLTKKRIVNTGQVPQYYVADDHPAIIDPHMFELVQQQLAVRKPGANRYSGVRDFSGSVYCSECGGRYGSKVYHSTDKYRRLVWRCNHKYDNGSRCSTPTLQEKDLQRFFITALNQLGNERKEIKAAFDECKEEAFDTTALEQEKAQVKADLLISSDQVARMIQANAALALNQEEYNKQFNVVCKRYDDLNARLTELEQTIADKESHRAEMESFMATLMKQPDMITAFDPTVYHVLVERMMIGTDGHVVVRFRNGMEVDVLIDTEEYK